VKKMDLNYLLAMVIATAIVALWNFGLSKMWVFKEKDKKENKK